ncbi:MAG: transcriptional regulator, partial [Methanoregulaceae archaeon]
CVLLIAPVSAYASSYSVRPWDDSPPYGDAKLPVPVGIWQVPPVTILLVFTALFLPFCLLPVEILVSSGGFVLLNFRRIRKKAVFGNDCRTLIYRHIEANPGSGFTGIMQNLPVNRGTLHYHLGVLCRERMVAAFSLHHRTFYFPNAGRFSDQEMDAIARLRTHANFLICNLLSSLPDASRMDIARKMNITGSTVSWHMRQLAEGRLVTSARQGKSVRYRLTPVAAKVMNELR